MNAMEYNLNKMFPDMSLLIQKKRNWDFQNLDLIRAMYVESETNILSSWKSLNAKLNPSKKPRIVLKNNKSNKLRTEFLRSKIEKERIKKKKYNQMLQVNLDKPYFPPVKTFTTVTAELRHSLIQNNPSVPDQYIKHFLKYKKPPFKIVQKIPSIRTIK